MRVNWSEYARQYDLMAERNPAYQELLAHCVGTVAQWPLRAESIIADFGAGTGNFSVALARALPAVSVLHVESDLEMLAIAFKKARDARLQNWRAVRLDLDDADWNLPPLDGAVTIHCLYATQHPNYVIRRICAALTDSGDLYACDIGRIMNMPAWACYLLGVSLRRRGLWETFSLLLRSSIIRKQNRLVARAQRAGIYWTHDLAQFRSCFEQNGITVSEASNRFYRGYDDLVIGRKQGKPIPVSKSSCQPRLFGSKHSLCRPKKKSSSPHEPVF